MAKGSSTAVTGFDVYLSTVCLEGDDPSVWMVLIDFSSGTSAPAKVTKEVLSCNANSKTRTQNESKTVGNKVPGSVLNIEPGLLAL